MPTHSLGSTNRVLARLSRADLALLKPHLQPVDLPLSMQLERAGQPIDHIYFFDSGFASVVADEAGRRALEVGIIGREGMSGVAIVLGSDSARLTTYIQVAGAGQRISAAKLRQAIAKRPTLHQSLLHCVRHFLDQTTQTALANGRNKNEERLARWLLMADDRIDGDNLPLTHQLLAIMLGVQRPAVTAAITALQDKGLIKARRGAIVIRDRPGLIRFSKGAYVPRDDA